MLPQIRRVFLLFLLLPISLSLYQSYAIRGKFFCGSEPSGQLRVRLGELDRSIETSDLLDEGLTDDDGHFQLDGGTAELTRIEPILEVTHDCGDGSTTGYRISKFLLPPFYITNNRRALKTFDLGVINLETVFVDEGRDYHVEQET